MIFADTGAWFALLVPSDVNHAEAVEWAAANRDEVMTSDMVVVETLTLLRARRQNHVALQLGEQFFDGTVRVERVTTQDLREAWQVFRRYADQGLELHGLHQPRPDAAPRHQGRVFV